jgi:hypothetical protein
MTKREIQENNRIIAEFIGWTYIKPKKKDFGWWSPVNKEGFDFAQTIKHPYLKVDHMNSRIFAVSFDNSWDWLMPVIAKCTKSFEHHQYDSEEYEYITEEIFHPDYCLSEFMNNNIMAIFERVVMYIKWYNAHKKVNPESIYGNDMMQR